MTNPESVYKLFSNIDFEKCILGCMIIDNSCIDEVSTKISASDFYTTENQIIFEAIKECYLKSKVVDYLVLCTYIENANVSYIASLPNNVSTSANVDYYINEVVTLSKKRKQRNLLIEQLNQLESGEDIDDNLQETETGVMNLMSQKRDCTVDMHELIPNIVEMMQKNLERTELYLGYNSGWENLNELLDGIQDGKLIVVGARPAMGKTSFALQLAANIASKNVGVSIFSFEMTARELGTRLCSLESGVDIDMIKKGLAVKSQNLMGKLTLAFNRIYDYQLSITHDSNICDKDLFALIKTQAKRDGKKVFIIDHLGLLHSKNNKEQRYEIVDDITIRLHHLAQDLNVAIILLCQLKRDSEGKRPTLSDLRESGAIEQNADAVIFIHRDREQNGEESIPAELIVEKNRDGKTGIAKMRFIPNLTKFIEDYGEKSPFVQKQDSSQKQEIGQKNESQTEPQIKVINQNYSPDLPI